MNECVQEPAIIADTQVKQLVAKARVAQAAFESFSQEQVDAIVKGIGKYVYDNAEELARMAVDETGIGVYEDKILKNKGKARVIWNNLKDKKSRGIIGEDPETNLVFVAKPMGVVGAVTPVTNPIVTPMCNAMFAIKTGNAVIFAPHPKAEKCTERLTDAFMKVVKANGGPDNLVQMVKKGSIEMTQELMKAVDVVVATGGGAMVKSAYSSGRPSFGVGAGKDDVLAKEKLCPVVAILPYKSFTDAVAKAKANLLVEGAGHSAAVHSNDEKNIREAGVELPISRLVVNQPSSLTAGGSLTNGFAPTTTLGCGSWGGNSISENLDYKHLMNVSRIGKVITGKKVPTDEEIWA